jgi:mannose-6-phosphate isomerase-like protein (cupin superfamily)
MGFVLGLQTPRGEVIWARHADGTPWSFALLTASSSTLASLRGAVQVAGALGHERPRWVSAARRLRRVIAEEPAAFLPKDRWSMAWYYPVLAGAGTGDAARAGPTEHPRLHSRPTNTEGMTNAPHSLRAGGIQAYKHVIPAGRPHPKPEPKSHEGYEWLYVLSGRLRLVLGELDLVLPPGEAAEFDCRTPHWFGRAGPEPVEFLSLFGPQGERLHVRARPASERAPQRSEKRSDPAKE